MDTLTAPVTRTTVANNEPLGSLAAADGWETLFNMQTTTEILYDYCDWELTTDGVCLHKGRPVAWYQDERTKKPWIPAKRKSWVSLVKGMERDGDITYLPNTSAQRTTDSNGESK